MRIEEGELVPRFISRVTAARLSKHVSDALTAANVDEVASNVGCSLGSSLPVGRLPFCNHLAAEKFNAASSSACSFSSSFTLVSMAYYDKHCLSMIRFQVHAKGT